ncbi:hypothetical protein BDZ89DRAFT_745440 [Hymenopellis radicata]|nr:hypothetical protein BDZ89DRAFT_745440 [Hymenopellis radicata]
MENALPVAQLESLKFKIYQIIESVQSLQRTLDMALYTSAMPPWPDILSKYNILLSQTHSLSTSLVSPIQAKTLNSGPQPNPYEQMALHPKEPDVDGRVMNLLRTQQILSVIDMENATIRRLSEHMITHGSVGVLGEAPLPTSATQSRFGAVPRKPEYEDVLAECQEIKHAHDQRVDRAIRAVTMLRDKYDWKQRLEVEIEEPEELDWDPRFHHGGNMDVDLEEESSDEDEVEDSLQTS